MASHLEGKAGLTDGELPRKLARAIVDAAARMEPLAVVQALDKCQSMAIKTTLLKSKGQGGKQSMEEIRKWVMDNLMKEHQDDGEESS